MILKIPEPPYLGPGLPLPKPTLFDYSDGSVLAFNADTLHGTHLNLTDYTRISLSTRINLGELRFNADDFRHVKSWMSSNVIESNLFVKELPLLPDNETINCPCTDSSSSENRPGTASVLEVAQTDPLDTGNTYKTHYSNNRKFYNLEIVKEEKQIAVTITDQLKSGEKVLIKTNDREFIVVQLVDGLKAFSNRCPHNGISLIDGYNDTKHIYCPGHGVAFDLETGVSKCTHLQLKTYPVEKTNFGFVINL